MGFPRDFRTAGADEEIEIAATIRLQHVLAIQLRVAALGR
jgi:hypothetical protein